MSSNYPQLKIAARASLKTATSIMLILAFVLPTVFSALLPREARAATTISKSLSRPVNELGLVGWWTMDGPDTLTNIADKSGQGNTGRLLHGGSGTTTAPGRIGQALNFDGVNDAVSAPINFSAYSKVAISFWMKWTAYKNTTGIAIEYTNNFNSQNGFLVSPDESGGTFEIYVSQNGSYSGGSIPRPSAGVWHHYGILFDRTTGTANGVTTYVDGVLQTMTQLKSDVLSGNFDNSTLYLMSRGASSLPAGGTLDDVRIYSRALSAAEITRLYQIGATSKIAKTLPGRDSLTNGLVGWWTMDGPDTLTNIADKSGQGNTGRLSHAGSGTTTAPGPIGQALNFDGVDDYVTMGDPASGIFDIGLQDWTASVWFKTTKSSVGQAYGMVSKSFYGGEVGRWAILQEAGNLEVVVANAIGTGVTAPFSETSYLDNRWHLITMRVSRTGNMDLYVDGISKASTDISGLSALNWQSSYHLLIGAYNDDVAGLLPLEGTHFTGSLDDVRIYSRALSAAEIKQLYNIGATSKIAKTLPGRDSLTSGLVGWWTMDGPDMLTNVADRSGQGNTGKLLHSGSGTTTAPGPIGQALNFDGVNDYVAVNPNAIFETAPRTYSAWIYPQTYSGGVIDGNAIFRRTGTMLNLSDIHAPTIPYSLRMFISGDVSSAQPYCENIGINLNRWQHVAVAWDGLLPFSGTFYINGVACSVSTIQLGSGAVNYGIGAIQYIGANVPNTSSYFDGKIDDARIYNRALSASEILQLYNMGR